MLNMLLISILIYAVPAKPGVHTVTQPDGTEIEIILNGDEFSNFITSIDGYLLKENYDGFFHYATMSDDGVISVSKFVYNVPSKRTDKERNFIQKTLFKNNFREISRNISIRKSAQQQSLQREVGSDAVGEKGLVILVNFTDAQFLSPTANADFHAMLNEKGYNVGSHIGSARDYFIASSDSLFQPTFDVYGPYNLPYNMQYYGGNNANGNDQRASVMIQHACDLAYTDGVDFSQYDNNGNGYVDNVFVFFAGYNEAEGAPSYTIWPHRSRIPGKPVYNGVKVYDYACTSELRGRQGGVMAGIGTFCHEFGHVLGLPDLYNTQTKNSVVHNWSLMDRGSYNIGGEVPCLFSAYEAFFCGWQKPTLLECRDSAYSLSPLTKYPREGFLVSNTSRHNLDGRNPNPEQFFILESRNRESWDRGLPASGMLIWRIDHSQAALDYNSPNNGAVPRIDIVRANGDPSALVYNVFGVFGYNSHDFVWSNTSWNKSLTNIIRNSNGSVSFDYSCIAPEPPAGDRNLPVRLTEDGSVIVSISSADLKNNLNLYVFSVTGQLVRMIPYSSFESNGQVVISGLPINNSYVISLGAVRKGKFAKVFVK